MNLCQQAESLCRNIAPIDLAEMPLYAVLQSEAGDLGNVPEGCWGYTMSSLDLYLEPILRNQGRWSMRGPTMLIADCAIRKEHPQDCFLQAFFSVAVHELAHILQRRETLISEQLLLGVMSLDEEKEFIASRIPTLNSPPLLHHDMRFSRILSLGQMQ